MPSKACTFLFLVIVLTVVKVSVTGSVSIKEITDKNEEITGEENNRSQFTESLQLGIERSVSSLISQPKRYVLMLDFSVTDLTTFTSDMPEMSDHKPEFTFITYAPVAFRHLRNFFGIQEDDFVATFCRVPLQEVSNPGRSGSGMYLSKNKYFIAKTVTPTEVDVLQTLLPAYLLNLYQNPNTLLPRFLGLYWYKQSIITSLHFFVMTNLMPLDLKVDLKYDLKGSTIQREASTKELKKDSPTYKDVDFMKHHPQGIYLKADDYKTLMKSIQNDSILLQSFEIMDYSLFLGIHYTDQIKEKSSFPSRDVSNIPCEPQVSSEDKSTANDQNNNVNNKHRQFGKTGLPGWTANGEKLVVYVGIIDILQTYKLKKKAEHLWKSIYLDRNKISAVNPAFYANRYLEFMGEKVFKMLPPCTAVSKK